MNLNCLDKRRFESGAFSRHGLVPLLRVLLVNHETVRAASFYINAPPSHISYSFLLNDCCLLLPSLSEMKLQNILWQTRLLFAVISCAVVVESTFFKRFEPEQRYVESEVIQADDVHEEEPEDKCNCECPRSKYVHVDVPKTQVKYYPINAPKEEGGEESAARPFKPVINKEIYKQIGDVIDKLENLTKGQQQTTTQGYVKDNGFPSSAYEETFGAANYGDVFGKAGSESSSGNVIGRSREESQRDQSSEPQQQANSDQSSISKRASKKSPAWVFYQSNQRNPVRIVTNKSNAPHPTSRSQLREFRRPNNPDSSEQSEGYSRPGYIRRTRSEY